MKISFVGHSRVVNHENVKMLVKEQIRLNIGLDERLICYLGGYGDFDSFAYFCAKKYKALHPSARLIFITPYYPPRETALKYDDTIYPALENVPPRFAISHRNRWMIARADIVIAYICHKFGGAYKTLTIAKHQNKPIFNITNYNI